MDMREPIRQKLLTLGARNLRAYQRAKLEFKKTGMEAASDQQIQAALLCYGICHMAEFLGLATYDEFEMEIHRFID